MVCGMIFGKDARTVEAEVRRKTNVSKTFSVTIVATEAMVKY